MYLQNKTQFTEVTILDNELTELSNHIASIKGDINNRETRRNEANITKANHTGYQPQAIYDEANTIYHAEGAAIGQLTRELQPLEQRCDVLYKQRGTLQRQLSESEAQRQYESETVEGNLAKIVTLSKAVIEQGAKLDKLQVALSALDNVASEQDERQAVHDRCKAEYLAIKRELEQAEAAQTLDASLPNPIALRNRVAEAKKKYDYTVKHLPTQVLLDSIAEKSESLQGEIASIEAEKKELDADRWAKRSLIAEIQIPVKITELLALVKIMIVCDGESKSGKLYLDKLQNNGLLLPVTFVNSPSIFDGLLDNLDDERARIQSEFEDDLTL